MTGTRRLGARAVMVVLVLFAGLLAASSVAVAGVVKEPTGDFAVFKQCPRFTTGVNLCLYAQITGGEMILNKLTIPTVNTVTLQGGIMLLEEPPFTETFVAALNGETLSPTPQPVPGGLSSLIDCHEIKHHWFPGSAWRRTCKALFENPWFSSVNATTELARPASEIFISKYNEIAAEGIALTMPVKIHLENPLLGRECYIGSNTDPVVFNFTTGTTDPPPPNTPITGSFGLISAKDEFNFAEVTEHLQVDNAFSAPEATGCGGHLAFLIDPLINSKIGLPSPAGYNTITHNGTAAEGTTIGVITSEQETEEEHQHHKKQGHWKGPNHWWH